MADAILLAIRRAAQVMPPGHAESFASSIEGLRGYGSDARRALDAVAAPAFRENAQAILDAWIDNPSVPGSAVALALRVGLQVRLDVLEEEAIEIVWTGPASREIPLRRTREVLLDLIDGAEHRLVIVSFAAYKVPEVISAIDRAGRRGVDARLILETSDDSSGKLTHDAANAFMALKDLAHFYVWPREKRVADTAVTGSLHAKTVLADSKLAFITSANLTGSALSTNMELGVLVRGGPLPRRLMTHFDELIARGDLQRVRTNA